jgi:superfamily I DNA/RNA helicase
MEWHIPFNALSPRQRDVLSSITQDLRRTHWIRGCAGTGKTLVMTHLAERVAAVDPIGSICFIAYTKALVDLVRTGIAQSLEHRQSREHRVSVMTHTAFLSERHSAKYVFLDEVQDISPEHLSKIRAKCDRLFVAGDPDQSIYPDRCKERHIAAVVSGRQFELVEVHRLTPEIRRMAEHVMPNASLVEAEPAKEGEAFLPQVCELDSESEEVEWVWARACECAVPGKPSVILLPTHNDIYSFARKLAELLGKAYPPRAGPRKNQHPDYQPFNDFWAKSRVSLSYLGGGFGSLPSSDEEAHTYIMTYHSSKGLDFANVFLPRLNESCQLVKGSRAKDDPELEDRLLYVAITRSRRRLFISHTEADRHRSLASLDSSVLEPFDENIWNLHINQADVEDLDDDDDELWEDDDEEVPF